MEKDRSAFQSALTSMIGRIVVALVSLVILPVLPTVVNFLNDVLGFALTDAEVLEYARNMAYGVAGLVAVWLLNRGRWETKLVELQKLLDAGEELANADVEPVDVNVNVVNPDAPVEPVAPDAPVTSKRGFEGERL